MAKQLYTVQFFQPLTGAQWTTNVFYVEADSPADAEQVVAAEIIKPIWITKVSEVNGRKVTRG